MIAGIPAIAGKHPGLQRFCSFAYVWCSLSVKSLIKGGLKDTLFNYSKGLQVCGYFFEDKTGNESLITYRQGSITLKVIYRLKLLLVCLSQPFVHCEISVVVISLVLFDLLLDYRSGTNSGKVVGNCRIKATWASTRGLKMKRTKKKG